MKDNKEFKVTFRGVRGSHPTPSINMLKYGGNTVSVEVNVNGHLIVLDAGTGVINLGNDLVKSHIMSGSNIDDRKAINAVILLSHTHHDHIHGIPFFKPAYIKSSKIFVYGGTTNNFDLKDVMSQSMFSHFFPLDIEEISAQISINNIKETEIILLHPNNNVPEVKRSDSLMESDIDENVVVIRCMKCYAHPKEGVLVFKITYKNKSLVYATDKEGYVGGDRKLISFARNADLLIHDAQYTSDDYISPNLSKQGFGHSTPEMAIEVAKMSNAKKLVLFHLDPSYTDDQVDKIEAIAKQQFHNSMVAYESLELNLL